MHDNPSKHTIHFLNGDIFMGGKKYSKVPDPLLLGKRRSFPLATPKADYLQKCSITK